MDKRNEFIVYGCNRNRSGCQGNSREGQALIIFQLVSVLVIIPSHSRHLRSEIGMYFHPGFHMHPPEHIQRMNTAIGTTAMPSYMLCLSATARTRCSIIFDSKQSFLALSTPSLDRTTDGAPSIIAPSSYSHL